MIVVVVVRVDGRDFAHGRVVVVVIVAQMIRFVLLLMMVVIHDRLDSQGGCGCRGRHDAIGRLVVLLVLPIFHLQRLHFVNKK